MSKFFFTVLFISLLSFPLQVQAQTASPSLTKQATVSAAPDKKLNKAITSYFSLLKVALARIEKIDQKIEKRLVKIRISNQTIATAQLVKLDTQQKTVLSQLDKLKKDLIQLELQLQALESGVSLANDFSLLKTQIKTFTKNLKDIYKLEQNLVSEMKKLSTIQATPTAKITPLP